VIRSAEKISCTCFRGLAQRINSFASFLQTEVQCLISRACRFGPIILSNLGIQRIAKIAAQLSNNVRGAAVIGSLPFFFGLAVVMPILGHSTWHLYRKVVEPPQDLQYARGYSLDEPYASRPPMGRFAGLAVGWVNRRSRNGA
jgi:hypothetical protein